MRASKVASSMKAPFGAEKFYCCEMKPVQGSHVNWKRLTSPRKDVF